MVSSIALQNLNVYDQLITSKLTTHTRAIILSKQVIAIFVVFEYLKTRNSVH